MKRKLKRGLAGIMTALMLLHVGLTSLAASEPLFSIGGGNRILLR